MSAKLADNALTTLEDVKIMLGIAPDDVDEQRDAMLVNLINYASAWIERMTGRKLGRQQYTQRYVASGTQELVLLQWPIINVEYVKDTTDGSIIPPEEYDYTVDGEIGVLYKDNGWTFRGYVGGLSYDFLLAARYLEVKYTAGYVLPKDATEDDPCTLPADLQGVVWGLSSRNSPSCRTGRKACPRSAFPTSLGTFDKKPARELAHDHWLTTPACEEVGRGDYQRHPAPRARAHQDRTQGTTSLENPRRHPRRRRQLPPHDSRRPRIRGDHPCQERKEPRNPHLAGSGGEKPEGLPRAFLHHVGGRAPVRSYGQGNGKFNFLFLLLPSVTIPERSFIRGSFDHGKNELAEACKAAINKIVLEGGTAREAAALIGERAAAMTQAYIMKGIDPPKSSITMETTKSGKPLYSTGRLYQSITYEIEEG